jgi:hypothetical protein
MIKYFIIFCICVFVFITIYVIYKNTVKSNTKDSNIILIETDEIPKQPTIENITSYDLNLYNNTLGNNKRAFKMFENGPWDSLNLAKLLNNESSNNLWNNCWTETNIATVNHTAIKTNINAGLRASDFVYIELVGLLKCGFNPPVDGVFTSNREKDPGAIPIIQNKIFYMFSEEALRNTFSNDIPLYVLDEFSGELQRFLITLTNSNLIVKPDDPYRSNYSFTNPTYIDNASSKSLRNILNNQASLIIGPKLKKNYKVDTFRNDIVLYNKNNNDIIYSGNSYDSYNNTCKVCISPIKLSTIINSDCIPFNNSNVIYNEFLERSRLFIYLTGGLKWGFQPRDKNGLFPIPNISTYENGNLLRIINDKLFFIDIARGDINISDPEKPKSISEFDLYLYDVIWEIDFSLHIKVEIFYYEKDFIWYISDYRINVSPGNNIADNELNIFTITTKPPNQFTHEPLFLYIGPKLYNQFDIYTNSNMIELYSVDNSSSNPLVKCSIYEGDSCDRGQSKYMNSEARAIKVCPPKPKEIDKIFSRYEIPVAPLIGNYIPFNIISQYRYDYKCIIISFLGPLSIGLSIPSRTGEFAEDKRYTLTDNNLQAIPISEKTLIIKSKDDNYLNIVLPISLYVYDNVYKILQIFDITRKSEYTNINGQQILNVYPAKIVLKQPSMFFPNIYQYDIPIAENQGVNIKRLTYIYIGPLILDNINNNVTDSSVPDSSVQNRCIPNCSITTFGQDDGCGSKCGNMTLLNSLDKTEWVFKISDPVSGNKEYVLTSQKYINRQTPDNSFPIGVDLKDTKGNVVFNVAISPVDYTNKNNYANINVTFNPGINNSPLSKHRKLLESGNYTFDRFKNKYIGNGIELYPNFIEEQEQCLIDYKNDIEISKLQDSLNIKKPNTVNINSKFSVSSSGITPGDKEYKVNPITFIRTEPITPEYIESVANIEVNDSSIVNVVNDSSVERYTFINSNIEYFDTPPTVFPKKFSLKDMYPDQIEEPRDQGKCAGCYAYTVASCLGDRFALKYNIKSPYPSALWMMGNCVLPLPHELVPWFTFGIKNMCRFCIGGIPRALAYWLQKDGYTKMETCFPSYYLAEYLKPPSIPFQEVYKWGECLKERPRLSFTPASRVKFSIVPETIKHIIVTLKRAGFYTMEEVELLIIAMKFALCSGPLCVDFKVTHEFEEFYSTIWNANSKTVFKPSIKLFSQMLGSIGGFINLPIRNTCSSCHACTITGWGVGFDKDGLETEYWECRNSWGTNNTGYFRVAISTFATQRYTIGLDIPVVSNPGWFDTFSVTNTMRMHYLKKITPFYFEPNPIENLEELIRAGVFKRSNNY